MPIYREVIGKRDISSTQQKTNILFNSTFLGVGSVTTLSTRTPRMAVDSHLGGAGSIPNEFRLNAATWTILDKFINNNNDNGGTAGALGADIKSLLAAMGDSGRRYGTEFAIVRLTCTATALASAYFNVHSYNTHQSIGDLAYWLRVVSKPQANFRRAPLDSDMIDARTGTRFDDGSWHYRFMKTNTWAEFDNYSNANFIIDVALPWLTYGSFLADKNEVPHTVPVLHMLEDFYK